MRVNEHKLYKLKLTVGTKYRYNSGNKIWISPLGTTSLCLIPSLATALDWSESFCLVLDFPVCKGSCGIHHSDP